MIFAIQKFNSQSFACFLAYRLPVQKSRKELQNVFLVLSFRRSGASFLGLRAGSQSTRKQGSN